MRAIIQQGSSNIYVKCLDRSIKLGPKDQLIFILLSFCKVTKPSLIRIYYNFSLFSVIFQRSSKNCNPVVKNSTVKIETGANQVRNFPKGCILRGPLFLGRLNVFEGPQLTLEPPFFALSRESVFSSLRNLYRRRKIPIKILKMNNALVSKRIIIRPRWKAKPEKIIKF